MTRVSRQRWFWLAVLALGHLALYALREVLAPFVAGAAIAYLLDPVCDRLQRMGLSRTWATTVVTLAFDLAAFSFSRHAPASGTARSST